VNRLGDVELVYLEVEVQSTHTWGAVWLVAGGGCKDKFGKS